MEELKQLLKDDMQEKMNRLQKKKKNRRKRAIQKCLITIVIVTLISYIYLISDLSKVKFLKVNNNLFYSDFEVLKKLDLNYETRFVFKPAFYLEHLLKKDPLIEDADVKVSLGGAILIDIQEKKMIGYYVDNNKNYLLLSNGKEYEIKENQLSSIVHFPLIDGFDKKERKNLAAAFANKQEPLKQEIISMISEINPYSTSYDQHMVKITMQDGNTIFTSYDSICMLNSYLDTLKELKKEKACLWPDIATGSIQSIECESKK